MISQQGTPKNSPGASLREEDPVIVDKREKMRSPISSSREREKICNGKIMPLHRIFYFILKMKRKKKGFAAPRGEGGRVEGNFNFQCIGQSNILSYDI